MIPVMILSWRWVARATNRFPLWVGVCLIPLSVAATIGAVGVMSGFETYITHWATAITGDVYAESLRNQAHRNQGLAKLAPIASIQTATPLYTGSSLLVTEGMFQVVQVIGVPTGSYHTALRAPFRRITAHPFQPQEAWVGLHMVQRLGRRVPIAAELQSPLTHDHVPIRVTRTFPDGSAADWGVVILSVQAAKAASGGVGAWAIRIQLHDRTPLEAATARIQTQLGRGWVVQSWRMLYPQLVDTLRTTQQVGVVVVVLVAGLAAVGLGIALSMLVTHHQRDMAILRLNGVSRGRLLGSVTWVGIAAGCLGGGLGLALGQGVLWGLSTILPFACDAAMSDRLWVWAGCVVCCTLSSLLPAAWASRIDPGMVLK
ncbi:FtsX-like permease family protein [bacterium]|nr:FtsX-like permease family protein [bacterium]